LPQVDVRCTVNNCRHWGNGDHCTAAHILVTTDEIGEQYPESIDASCASDIVRQHGHTAAGSCMQTCCKTFAPREGSGGTHREPSGSLVDIF
jgi:hypothetical protein